MKILVPFVPYRLRHFSRQMASEVLEVVTHRPGDTLDTKMRVSQKYEKTHSMLTRSRAWTALNWSSGSISTFMVPSCMETSCTGTACSTLRHLMSTLCQHMSTLFLEPGQLSKGQPCYMTHQQQTGKTKLLLYDIALLNCNQIMLLHHVSDAAVLLI